MVLQVRWEWREESHGEVHDCNGMQMPWLGLGWLLLPFGLGISRRHQWGTMDLGDMVISAREEEWHGVQWGVPKCGRHAWHDQKIKGAGGKWALPQLAERYQWLLGMRGEARAKGNACGAHGGVYVCDIAFLAKSIWQGALIRVGSDKLWIKLRIT